MGLGDIKDHTYFSITLGRIRRRTDENDPKGKKRELKDGTVIHELVYSFIEGTLDKIQLSEHEKYGKSWQLYIHSGDDNYVVQVSENSRFGNELLKRIPNLKIGSIYKFTPYDFKIGTEKKIGLTIEDGNGAKVNDYYHSFTEKSKGVWEVKELHGYPAYTGDPKDKDELKIYFQRVTLFLRKKALEYLKNTNAPISEDAKPATIDEIISNETTDENDDLPF